MSPQLLELWGLPCHLLFDWLAFLLSPQAIEDEGGNPDEIEVTSEGNKKMPKRPSKGMEPLGHLMLWVPCGCRAFRTSCLLPSVTQDLNM